MSLSQRIAITPDPITFLPPAQVKEIGIGIFEQTTKAATIMIQGETKEGTPVAFGILRNSILVETRVTANEILGVVATAVPYAAPVEEGSRPHFPPLNPLILWVKRKGLIDRRRVVSGPTGVRDIGSIRDQARGGSRRRMNKFVVENLIEGIARRIQWKIAKKGSKGHFMFTKAFDKMREPVESLYNAAIDKFLNRLK